MAEYSAIIASFLYLNINITLFELFVLDTGQVMQLASTEPLMLMSNEGRCQKHQPHQEGS